MPKRKRRRTNKNETRKARRANRYKAKVGLSGVESLEDRRVMAVTSLPFVAETQFNQFSGIDSKPLGFGITGVGLEQEEPEFLGFEFDETVEIGGFTEGFLDDTYWGAEGKLVADGRVGIEYGYYISEGLGFISNEGDFQYEVKPRSDGKFDLVTFSSVDNSRLRTLSPTISAYADLRLKLDGSISGQACAGVFGCSPEPVDQPGGDNDVAHKDLDIDVTVPLISINRQVIDEDNPNAPVEFDGDFKFLGFGLSGGSVDLFDDVDEARKDQFEAENEERRALSDLENATTSAERDAAQSALNDARAKKSQGQADAKAVSDEVTKERAVDGDPEADTAGFGLSIGPAGGDLLGVNIAVGAEAQVGVLSASKEFGSLTLTLPEVNLGDDVANGGDLFASTNDDGFDPDKSDLAKLSLHIGTILSNQIPGLGTNTVGIGPLSATLTSVDYTLNGTLDVTQDFEADFQEEFVTVRFLQTDANGNPTLTPANVNATGSLLNSSGNPVSTQSNVSEIRFKVGDPVQFEPIGNPGEISLDFKLERAYEVTNGLGLGFGLDGTFTALAAKLNAAFGPLEMDLIDIGPLIENSHDLFSTDLPVTDLKYPATTVADAFAPETITVGADLQVAINDPIEVIVDDSGFPSHREFSFDVDISNAGLSSSTGVEIELRNLNLESGTSLTASFHGTSVSCAPPTSGDAELVCTLPSLSPPLISPDSIGPGEAITVEFSGTTSSGAADGLYDAIIEVTAASEVDVSDNQATTAIPIQETMRFYVGRGGIDVASPARACTDIIVGSLGCSLREAVAASNFSANVAPSVIEILPEVTQIDSSFLLFAPYSLLKSVAIVGQGSDATELIGRDGLFAIGSGSPNQTYSFRGMTLSASPLDANETRDNAAISLFNSNNVFVDDVTFDGHTARAIDTTFGNLNIENSKFVNNSAESNFSPKEGGAIRVNQSTLTIKSSQFVGNSADFGAAIYTSSSDVHIEDSAIHGNIVGDSSGGVVEWNDIFFNGSPLISTAAENQFTADGLIIYDNTGNNFAGLESWHSVAQELNAQYLETDVKDILSDGTTTGAVVRDIGIYDESTGGGISYEFIYTASDTADSSSLMGSLNPPVAGEGALRFEQFQNTEKFGVTVGAAGFTSTIDYVVDRRAHVVFVADGLNMELWVDGIQRQTIPAASLNLSGLVGLGQVFDHVTDDGADVLDGTIHGFAAYDRALTQNEVSRLAAAGLGIDEQSTRIISDDDSHVFDQEFGSGLENANVNGLVKLSFPLVEEGVTGATVGEVIWQVPSREIIKSESLDPNFVIDDEVLKLAPNASLSGNASITIRGEDALGRTLEDTVIVSSRVVPATPVNVQAEVFPGFQELVEEEFIDDLDFNETRNNDFPMERTENQMGDFAIVTWDLAADTEYIVRAVAEDADGIVIDARVEEIGANTLTEGGAGFVNLMYDTDYTFSVQARNQLASSAKAFSAALTTHIAPPAEMRNLVVTQTQGTSDAFPPFGTTEGSISLSWDAADRAFGYQVFVNGVAQENHFRDERNQPCTAGSDGCMALTRLADDPSFVFDVAPDTEYEIEIRGVNASGFSVGRATILSHRLPVTAPVNVSVAMLSQTRAKLEWTTARNVEQYEIVGKLVGEPDSAYVSLLSIDDEVHAGTTSQVVEGLLPNQEYDFRVVATNRNSSQESLAVTGSTATEVPGVVVTTTSSIESTNDFQTSLVEAIRFANNNPGPDVITFDTDGLFGTAQTIFLTRNLPTIRDSLTIVGNDLVEISGNGQRRIFQTEGASTDLTLENLTLSNGNSLNANFNTNQGGAIYFGSNLGTLKLINSHIANSVVSSSSANDAEGGAIYALGKVELVSSSLTGNSAVGNLLHATGGGIHAENTVTLTDSLLEQNFAFAQSGAADGGAVFARNRVDMLGTTLRFNRADGGNNNSGGGVFVDGGSVSVIQSVLTGNEALGNSSKGGAIAFSSDDVSDLYIAGSTLSRNQTDGNASHGGAIYAGNVTLTNATVANNHAYGSNSLGGGIHAENVTLTNVTVTSNTSASEGGGVHAQSTATLSNSILVGNRSDVGSSVSDLHMATGAANELNENLFGSEATADSVFELTAAVPGSFLQGGLLADNGAEPIGPFGTTVQTVALKRNFLGNPALDLNPFDSLTNIVGQDARGVSRSIDLPNLDNGGTVDGGAFELQRIFIVDSLADIVLPDGQFTLAEAILAANELDGVDTIVFSDQLNRSQGINLNGQLPTITDALLIDASDLDERMTITGSGSDRIFNFDGSGSLLLENLHLTGGKTTGNNSSATDNTHSGGAIYFDSTGALVLRDSLVTGNSTGGAHARGGAIFAGDNSVYLFDSEVSYNFTLGNNASGGAIHAYRVFLREENSIAGNYTAGFDAPGGAVFANYSVYGNSYGSLNLSAQSTASRITNNHTTQDGSAGGAIYASNQVFLEQTVLSGNFTMGDNAPGGAVRSYIETGVSNGSLVTDNRTEGNNSPGGALSSFYSTGLDVSSASGNRTYGANSPGGAIHGQFAFAAQSTIAGNSTVGANSPGGGIGTSISGGVSPIHQAFIDQSTIANNSTARTGSGGGGIATQDMILRNSTLSGNSTNSQTVNQSGGGGILADSTKLYNSLVLGNYAHNSSDDDLKTNTFEPYGLSLVSTFSQDGANGAALIDTADNIFADTTNVLFDADFDGIAETPANPAIVAGRLSKLSNGSEVFALNPDLIANAALDGGDDAQVVLDVDDLDGDGDTTEPVPFDANGFSRFVNLQSVFGGDLAFAMTGSVSDLGSVELQSLTSEPRSLMVTTTEDVVSDFDQVTSLREAIEFANSGDADGIPGTDTITFDASLAGMSLVLDGQELDINQDLVIDASSIGGITIDANRRSRAIHFDAETGDLELNSVTVANGVSTERGGGIRFDSGGILRLTSSRVTGNQTMGDLASGGGIYAVGQVDLNESLVDGNSTSGDLSLGGGVSAPNGMVNVNNSTIFGNDTTGADSYGGGIYADVVSLTNATVVNNSVTGDGAGGGGVYGANLTKSRNSIVLGNFSAADQSSSEIQPGDMLTFEDGNIVGESKATFDTDGTSVLNAKMKDVFVSVELADNGGLNPSIALKPSPTNPALDAGFLANAAVVTDQRGLTRSVDLPGITGFSPVDLGAVELQAGIEELPGLVVTTGASGIDPFDFATSLREAINFANSSIAGVEGIGDADNDGLTTDTITFADGLETVQLIGEIPISSSLTISGPGADILTIDASGTNQRIFVVNAPGAVPEDVTIRGVTLTGGGRTDQPLSGGAIFNRENLTVIDSVITGNSSTSGGAIYSDGASTLLISNSEISNNTVVGYGGGIRTFGTATIVQSSFVNNQATGAGGGIDIRGDLTVDQTEFVGNSSNGGGAISIFGADSVIKNSSFIDNDANFNGAALLSFGNTNAFLANSTVSGSTSSNGARPAVFLQTVAGNTGLMTIRNVTFADNAGLGAQAYSSAGGSATLDVGNSIFAGNGSTNASASGAATFVTSGSNISDDTSSGFNAAIDLTNTDPLLGTLDYHGGRTRSYDLLSDSPAIDAGENSLAIDEGGNALATDQRGFNRIVDGTVDIGSHESDLPEPVVDSIAFVGSRVDGQVELFKSDGTNSGATGILKNVGGSQSSNPHELTVVGDRLFFAATGADGEVELFVTEPNGATQRFKDIAGTISSNPHELTVFNGQLHFIATGADGETELMVTDGTKEGTVRVKNLSGNTSSEPENLTIYDGRLYSTALSTTGERELYVSDSTGPGTTRLVNLYGVGTNSSPSDLMVAGGKLFFVATTPSGERELHMSNGTAAGTGIVQNLSATTSSNPQELTEFNGELYFVATLANGNAELHKSDGTAAGTQLVGDLSGTTSSNPRELTVMDNQLFFVATTSAGQDELHSTDGFAIGLVANLHGNTNANPQGLEVFNGKLYFSALGNDGERELYVSNGTAAGTVRLKDIAGTASSNPHNLTAVGETLYFAATLATGETELFSTDGTAANTALVKNLAGSPAPREIVAFSVDPGLDSGIDFGANSGGPGTGVQEQNNAGSGRALGGLQPLAQTTRPTAAIPAASISTTGSSEAVIPAVDISTATVRQHVAKRDVVESKRREEQSDQERRELVALDMIFGDWY